MMQSQGLEHIAPLIAENVASAFERAYDGACEENEREMLAEGLVRELLSVLPTTASDVFAYACSRHLSMLAKCGMDGPRVEAVDPENGSVTMTSA